MNVTLWGTRGSLATPGAETARYGGNTSCVGVIGDDGTVLVLDAGTGIRGLGQDHRHVRAPRGHPAHPPAHGSHPGTGILRATLSQRPRGPHLGTGEQPRQPSRAADALSVAAVVSGEPARIAVHDLAARCAARRCPDRRIPRDVRAGVSSGADGGLPHHRRAGQRAHLPAGPRAGAGRCARSRRCRWRGHRVARSPRVRTC